MVHLKRATDDLRRIRVRAKAGEDQLVADRDRALADAEADHRIVESYQAYARAIAIADYEYRRACAGHVASQLHYVRTRRSNAYADTDYAKATFARVTDAYYRELTDAVATGDRAIADYDRSMAIALVTIAYRRALADAEDEYNRAVACAQDRFGHANAALRRLLARKLSAYEQAKAADDLP